MYTTRTLIEQYLGNSTDLSSIDSFVTLVISATQSYIDNMTGMTFEVGSAVARYYDTNGKDIVFIDPFIGNATVEILDVYGNVETALTVNEDYYLYPLNNNIKSSIELAKGSPSAWRFANGGRRLKVTATWGASDSVPDDVKVAATMIAAKVLEGNAGASGSGEVQSESLGDYSITYATNSVTASAAVINAEMLLAKYISIAI